MLAYQPAAARPRVLAAPRSPQLGSMSSLTFTDWGLLLGGAVVGGAGINNLVGQFRGPKRINAISVMLNLVLAGVGVTLFVQKGSQAIA